MIGSVFKRLATAGRSAKLALPVSCPIWVFRPSSDPATISRSPAIAQAGDAAPVWTGTICQAGPITVGGTPSYRLVVDDGTGRITVVFIGRRAVPGLVDGTRCSVEGTAQRARGRLEVWNPHYRVEGPTADTARPGCGAP